MKLAIRILCLLGVFALAWGAEVQAANLVKAVKSSKIYDSIKGLDNVDDIDFKEAETEFGEKQIIMMTTFDDDDVIEDVAKQFAKANKDMPKEVLERFDVEKILKSTKISLVTTFTFNSDGQIKEYSTKLLNGSAVIEDMRANLPDHLIISLATGLLNFGYLKDLNVKVGQAFAKAVNQLLKDEIVIIRYSVVSGIGTPLSQSNSDYLKQVSGNRFELPVSIDAIASSSGDEIVFRPSETIMKLQGTIYYAYTENNAKDLMIDLRKSDTYKEIPVKSGFGFPIVIGDGMTVFILLPDKCVFGEKLLSTGDMSGPALQVAGPRAVLL